MNSRNIWRIAIAIGAFALFLGLLYLLRDALIPVLVALLLAYMLDPLIRRMESRYINRTTAIIILGLAAIIVVGGVLSFLVIQAQKEIVQLFNDLPEYLARAQTKVEPLARQYLGIHIPKTFDEIFATMKKQIAGIDPATLKPVTALVTKVTSKTVAMASWLVSLILIPVFLFYFLRDWQDMQSTVAQYIPPAHRGYLLEKFRQLDEVLGGFIRGQLTVCVVLGVLYSIGLYIVGINLAVVIGMGSGLAYIVPYMGTALGVIAGSIMSLLQHGLSWHLVGVWGVFAFVQAVESTLVTPRIVGKKVGLKPVVVIISVLIGADLLGLVGILVAVPIAAVLNVFVRDGLERYKKSALFLEKPKEKA